MRKLQSASTYLRVQQETELSVDVIVDDLLDPRPKFDTPVAARLYRVSLRRKSREYYQATRI